MSQKKEEEGGAAFQRLYDKFPVPKDFVDLSKFDKPVSKEFGVPLPDDHQEWSQFKLSPEQVDYFNTYGYVKNIPVLTPAQVDMLTTELVSLSDVAHPHPGHGLFYEYHANESGDPNNVLLHALGHWRITPGFHDVIFHPAITVPASQLLGDVAVRVWHDQVFAKPPFYGGCVAWHQDYSYWTRTVPMAHLTIHIALDDQTEENGCLHYIPGSHHWTDAPLPIVDRHFGDMESIKTILTEEQKKNFVPTPMLLKKGEACFHHPLTIHGSFPNRSANPRRAAVVNVFADGTKSNTNDILLDGVPVSPPGAKMEGQFFPMLYDPSCRLI